MLNNRLNAARDIAAKLHALESAIDDALAHAGELTSVLPKARKLAGVSAIVGQDAIWLTGQSLAALHEARAKIVAAHLALTEVQTQVGLKTRMSGEGWKPPSLSATLPPLQLVDDIAA